MLTYNLSDHVKEGMAAARGVASAIYAQLGAQEHTDHSPRDDVAPLGNFRYRDHDYSYAGVVGQFELSSSAISVSVHT